jgi:uncharacterized protein
MDILLIVIAVIAGVIGIVGSIVPGLPGPPVSWIGLLLAYFGRRMGDSDNEITLTFLLVWFVIMVIVTVLDYVVPAKFTKMAGGSKAASTGAIVGLLAGMFIPPIGMIVGSLLGAFLAEILVEAKDVGAALKSSLGAFAGFLFGTGMKLIASGLMLYYIIF